MKPNMKMHLIQHVAIAAIATAIMSAGAPAAIAGPINISVLSVSSCSNPKAYAITAANRNPRVLIRNSLNPNVAITAS